MSTILKALSIVKKEDASEVRSASEQHLKKIKELKEENRDTKNKQQLDIHIQEESLKTDTIKRVSFEYVLCLTDGWSRIGTNYNVTHF